MFAISKTLKGRLSGTPSARLLGDIKNSVLGKKYLLSLVFIGDKLSKRINKKHRKKDRATNVLSFPLSKNEGEIFLNLPLSRKESRRQNTGTKSYVMWLFIHACLHLKGFEHGRKMEEEEGRLLRKFAL